MYKPIKTNRTFKLCGYVFDIYSIDGFDFDKGINISPEKGVYCFSKEVAKSPEGKERMCFVKQHKLIYLGKSEDKDGIDGRLVASDEQFPKIKKFSPKFLSIHICKHGEDAENIEGEILEKFFFFVNKQKNKEIGNKKFLIWEDPE